MSKNERRDDGTYEKRISNDEFLEVFEESEKPVLTAKLISEELPITKNSVNVRLNKLHEDGCVERMKVGANAVVWWTTE